MRKSNEGDEIPALGPRIGRLAGEKRDYLVTAGLKSGNIENRGC